MQPGWTVLFYIYEEDRSTKIHADRLLKDLLAAKDDESLILLVFESIHEDKGGGEITGRLYTMEYNDRTGTREKALKKDFGLIDPGDAGVLENVLQFIKKNKLLREKFLLFTWDHGAGFGIFDGDPRVHQVAGGPPPKKAIGGKGNGKENLRVARNGRAHDLSKKVPAGMHPGKIKMLTVADINQALRSLKRRTDLVIMLNCWMQMLEAGYELSGTVDILVASETVNFFAGYDYTRIINRMANHPASTGEDIARLAIQTIPANYKKKKAWEKDLKELVISATRPAISQRIVDALDKAADDLLSNMPAHFRKIKQGRKSCEDLSCGYFMNKSGKPDRSIRDFFIDPLHYISVAAEKGLVSPARLQALQQATKEYILLEYCGQHYRMKDPSSGIRLCNGYSIFHPADEKDFDCVYYHYFYKTHKIKLSETRWAAYLDHYKAKKNR